MVFQLTNLKIAIKIVAAQTTSTSLVILTTIILVPVKQTSVPLKMMKKKQICQTMMYQTIQKKLSKKHNI